MSLYDDCDVKSRAQENVSGWSSSIKLLQSQLQLKKATVTQPKRDVQRKVSLAPVIDLKTGKSELIVAAPYVPKPKVDPAITNASYKVEFDWNIENEYDPLWPNEYEKIVRELRDIRDRDSDDKRRTERRQRKSRFADEEEDQQSGAAVVSQQASLPSIGSGFARRWNNDEEEEREREPPSKMSRAGGGAAIAPPPSLQAEVTIPSLVGKKSSQSMANAGGSVAAKIMAKYGFKEGQGLGKQEQGMSMALQVEKTSKRGGRIIHEREVATPPHMSMLPSFEMAPPPPSAEMETMNSPDEFAETKEAEEEPNITEIIKKPSKVVLLRNMVGPGEVDDDLEPEVKEECNTKYGEVATVVIHEVFDPLTEVRIFVEFKRIENAIKAVVDLNGRFFGGRQVKAIFYDPERFYNFQLTE